MLVCSVAIAHIILLIYVVVQKGIACSDIVNHAAIWLVVPSAPYSCALLMCFLIWSIQSSMKVNKHIVTQGENAWTLGQSLATMVAIFTIGSPSGICGQIPTL